MRILILGCGWLASAFAMEQRLRGHEVWASTTNKEKYHRLKNDGIFSFIANFDHSDFRDSVAIPREFDFVLNSVPASQKNDLATLQNRFLNIQSFLSNLRWNKHVFLSSVGIYPDQDGWFDEKYNERSKLSEKLLVAEELPPESLQAAAQSGALPPFGGALLKNEQDLQLLDQMARMQRRAGR